MSTWQIMLGAEAIVTLISLGVVIKFMRQPEEAVQVETISSTAPKVAVGSIVQQPGA